jgi:hypothetical protein
MPFLRTPACSSEIPNAGRFAEENGILIKAIFDVMGA